MCCSGSRRALQRSWTEVKKKCSIAQCILPSSRHPRGMTVGTKSSAAADCLKYLTLLCRPPSFFLTRKQTYVFRARFCIQVSKQRSRPLRRTAEGDPSHSKITGLMPGCAMCLYHEHSAQTHMLGNCIHSSAPANRDVFMTENFWDVLDNETNQNAA